MKTLTGTVSKIHVVKYLESQLLIRFTLTTPEKTINCVIAKHSLNFFADVNEGMQIVVCGIYNSRNQLVVKKYSVLGKTRIMIEMETTFRIK